MAWGIVVKDSDGDVVIDNDSLIGRLMYDGPAEGPYYTEASGGGISNLYGMNYLQAGGGNVEVGNGGDTILWLDGVSAYGFSTSSSLVLVNTEEVKGNLDTANHISYGPSSSPLSYVNNLVQAWDFNSTYLFSTAEQGFSYALGQGAFNELDYKWYEVRNKIRPIVVYFG